ncbi:multiubiquitin domain-containing protein [Leifsonia shinshuensis]|uniref:Uncharacterized protein n=1 Tax=Leifsonia shinshuensis TaxID=150026 RepID=A0A7G6YA62_9MICO|nr:multiubiquitin domain-containing protein [Leifsonia shinshuensis]QNE35377.1 hypothetical protein F1C12_09705 [Leifsonia shinshuensis]
MTTTESIDEFAKAKSVDVLFNKQQIVLQQRKYTGLELKEAAIRQGVAIQLTFVLFELKHNGRRTPIGDHDTVQVNKESEFAAMDNDDNS